MGKRIWKLDMNKNRDLTKLGIIDPESEPNLIFTHRDLDIMLDGNVVALKFITKGDEKIIMICCFMLEATDKIYDSEDLLQMKKRYKVMIMQFEKKMIEHMYDRDIIHVIHVEPFDQYSPTEFWIMSEQTKDDMDKYADSPKQINERFQICEKTELIPKGKNI